MAKRGRKVQGILFNNEPRTDRYIRCGLSEKDFIRIALWVIRNPSKIGWDLTIRDIVNIVQGKKNITEALLSSLVKF